MSLICINVGVQDHLPARRGDCGDQNEWATVWRYCRMNTVIPWETPIRVTRIQLLEEFHLIPLLWLTRHFFAFMSLCALQATECHEIRHTHPDYNIAFTCCFAVLCVHTVYKHSLWCTVHNSYTKLNESRWHPYYSVINEGKILC